MGPPMFQKGQRIGDESNRWIITRKLGEGQFAEVYEVKDAHRDRDVRHAMKIERRKDIKSVKQELKILKRLREACSSDHICDIVESGVHDERFYIVMKLLGQNLVEVQRRVVGARFDAGTVRAIACCTLDAIQVVHNAGFIHRDIKPANFAVHPVNGEPAHSTWVIIDFGLARRYVDEAGEVFPERTDTAFRGSTTYASVHAHMEKDLGRRDDLWSWLYCVVELLDGTLPWRTDKEIDVQQQQQQQQNNNRDHVHQLKLSCVADPLLLTRNVPLPEPLAHVSNYLRDLNFGDRPDYDRIRSILSLLPAPMPGRGSGGTYAGGNGHMQGSPSPYRASPAAATFAGDDPSSSYYQYAYQQQQQQQHQQQVSWPHWTGGSAPSAAGRHIPPTPTSPPQHNAPHMRSGSQPPGPSVEGTGTLKQQRVPDTPVSPALGYAPGYSHMDARTIADSPASPFAEYCTGAERSRGGPGIIHVASLGDAEALGYSVPILMTAMQQPPAAASVERSYMSDSSASPGMAREEAASIVHHASARHSLGAPAASKRTQSMPETTASPPPDRNGRSDTSLLAVQTAWGSTGRLRESAGADGPLNAERAEEAVMHDISGCVTALNLGMVSSEAQQLAARLGALHPVDALAVMASVVHGAAEGVHPTGGHALAQALFEFSLFSRHAAERADARSMASGSSMLE